jgi:hypothetical protein
MAMASRSGVHAGEGVSWGTQPEGQTNVIIYLEYSVTVTVAIVIFFHVFLSIFQSPLG